MSAGKPEKKNRIQSTRTQGAERAAAAPVRSAASVDISAVIRACSREWRMADRLSKGDVRCFAGAFAGDRSMRHRARSGKLTPPARTRRSADYGDGHGDNSDPRNHIDHIVSAFGWQRQQHQAVKHQGEGKKTPATAIDID